MKILVARIPEEGSSYKGEDPASILEAGEERFIREKGDVEYDLYAQRVSGELVVRGSLCAEVDLQCARCSEFFSTTVGVSDFLRAYSAPEGTDAVDITDDMREELLLHIPGFPLCNEECKGVCPQCGENLNQGGCACSAGQEAGAWSALDDLDL